MPEGPSIVILREQVAEFAGRKILRVEGNTTIDKQRFIGKRIVAIRSWGKHFLIELPDCTIRIHFLLFGTYRINDRKPTPPRLSLKSAQGELNFYVCSVRILEGNLDELYDWSVDLLSDAWDGRAAITKLRAEPKTLVCDAVLDQMVFAGAGNIFKNEVLFRIRVHPLSAVGALPAPKLRELVREMHRYAYQFLEWKKAFVLKKHWLAHTKFTCPRCAIPFKKAPLGRTHRRSFYCERCQVRYRLAGTKRPAKRARAKKSSAAQPIRSSKVFNRKPGGISL